MVPDHVKCEDPPGAADDKVREEKITVPVREGGWQPRDSKNICGGAELRRCCSWYMDQGAGMETSFRNRMRKWPARKAKVMERGLFCGTQHFC